MKMFITLFSKSKVKQGDGGGGGEKGEKEGGGEEGGKRRRRRRRITTSPNKIAFLRKQQALDKL